ncbi:hypothetical protein FRX31_004527 [Thalictrum thalictroides]|uniref:FBD domain-containing protein n=1 Tax=Thalictrum thalictroides TaxID=46969 RepID=A0A7J6XAC7_THATH|nr:hypothetical protein FRX31_004527 [Thalictrum thalictroides]
MLDKTLAKFDELRYLVIDHPRTEFLSIDTAPERLRNTYHHLATLSIAFNIRNLKELQAVICLCRSSPRLSMFKILFRVPKNGQHVLLYEGNFWKAKLRKREGVFLHLKTIYMDRFSGVQHEIRFIQFILRNAVVLKKFYIRWVKESTITDNEKQLVVKNVLQLRRASQKVDIIFDDLNK